MTDQDIQQLINSNSEAVLTRITLNSTTSTTLSTEKIGPDKRPTRIAFEVTNIGNQRVWIKKQAASVDNDKKGRPLERNGTYWMSRNIYKGEISAIAENGNPEVAFDEY